MPKLSDEWPHSFTRADRRRFAALLGKAMQRAGLRTTGAIPDLRTEDGGFMSVRNLLDECASISASRWPARIAVWTETVQSSRKIFSEADTMSAEIAEASFRIRLFADEDVPDFMVTRPAMPGLVAALYLARPGFGHNARTDMLERWGFGIDEAFEIARANTLRREPIEFVEHDDYSVLEGPSIYASSHVFSLEPAETPDGSPPLPLIVGIPTRHCVVLEPLRPPGTAIATVLAQTYIRFRQGPGPTHHRAWLFDAASFGRWGEGAEPVDVAILSYERDDIRCRITMGPRLQAMYDAFRPAAA